MGTNLPCKDIWKSVCFVLVLLFVAQAAFAQSATATTQAFSQNIKEVHFPFNIYNRIVDPAVLEANSTWLKGTSDKMWIQGYADPRGDIVYNLVLSYRRAQWVKSRLEKSGVDTSRIEYATGWGKLYQTCEKNDEQCFQENRRVDIVPPESMMFHGAGQ
jgi:outer membrane protein OmpA-like peptidoglycan-associated protein